ncbi:MAG: hypothetical protein QOJ62_2865 [Actinomycetota bacterium]|nr:hypothetical protein [Actinomycetota bacterium]
MPHLPFRPFRPDPRDESDAEQLDALLEPGSIASVIASGMDPHWQAVSDALGAAARPPTPDELSGEAAMLAAFRGVQPGVSANRRQLLVRPRMLATVLTGKLAAALAIGAVSVTGAATAAFADALPRPVQNFAHHTIGAPAAHENNQAEGTEPSETPTPSATLTGSASPSATASESHSPEPSESPDPSESAEHASHSATPTSTLTPTAVSAKTAALCHALTEATKHGQEPPEGLSKQLTLVAPSASAFSAFCATVKDDDDADDVSSSASPSASATLDADGDYDGSVADHAKGFRGANPSPSPTPAPAAGNRDSGKGNGDSNKGNGNGGSGNGGGNN